MTNLNVLWLSTFVISLEFLVNCTGRNLRNFNLPQITESNPATMDSVQNNVFKYNPNYHEVNKKYPYSTKSQEPIDESFKLTEELSDGVFDEEMFLVVSKVSCASSQTLKFPKIVEVEKSSEKLTLPQLKRRQNYFLKLNDIVAESNQNLAEIKKYADLKAKIVHDSNATCRIIEQGTTLGIPKYLPESRSKVNWYDNAILQISRKEMIKPTILVADPNEVTFRNHRAGNTYRFRVKVRNISNHPCRFSILPLSKRSPFSIQWKCCVGRTKILAPGNFINIMITFHCVLNEDVSEKLLIRVENGEDMNIPIKAKLTVPYLKVPYRLLSLLTIQEETRTCSIECGRVLLGDTNEVVLRLRNNGCDARFWILSEDSWHTLDIQDTDTQNTVHMKAFALRPTYFCILSYDVIDLHIQFTPANEGFHLVRAMVLCDNHTVKALDLFGDAYLFDFSWIEFKDMEKTFCIDITDDESSEFYLDLGIIQCGSSKSEYFEIHNSGCINLSCHWDLKDVEIPGTFSMPPDLLHIIPQEKSLCSKCTCSFRVVCTMGDVYIPGKYQAVASLIIDNVPRKSIAVCDKQKIVRANDDEGIVSVEVGRMEIWVECAFPVLSINPWIVTFSDEVYSDGTDTQTVTVINSSPFPINVHWINPQYDSFIKIEPDIVSIEEDSSAEFSLSLSALCEESFRQVLLCVEYSSDVCVELLVINQVVGRDLDILIKSLDFGLVKQNSHRMDYLLLKKTTNDQNVWSLKEYKFNTDKSSRGILTRIDDPASRTSAVDGSLCHEGSIACVSYTLDTKNEGIWCSLLEWVVNGKSRCIPVIADIQTTNILMDKIIVKIGEPLFLNIPVTLGVTLYNRSLLPTYVRWQKPIGPFKNNVIVSVVPSETVIVATSTRQFSIHIEPKMLGVFSDLIIPCEVELQSKPLFLSVSGEVHGLSVTFKWQIASQNVEVMWSQAEKHIEESKSNKTSQNSSEVTVFRVSNLLSDLNDTDEGSKKDEISEMNVMENSYGEKNTISEAGRIPYLNWPIIGGNYTRARMEESFFELIFTESVNGGSKELCTLKSSHQLHALIFDNIACREPVTQTFYINNKSSISASFTACAIMYEAADLNGTKSIYTLLKQIQKKLSTDKINDSWFERVEPYSGIAIDVQPSRGTLPANDYVCISVTVYAHTWGCYNTAITVRVGNLVPFPLQLIATVHSPPISISQTFVRFGNVLYGKSKQSRTVTVQNNSYLHVYISWQIFLKRMLEKDYPFKVMLVDNNNFYEPPLCLSLTPYYGSYCLDLFQVNENCTLLEPWSLKTIEVTFNPAHYIIDLDFHKRSTDLHGTLVGHVFLTHDSRQKSDAKNCIHNDGAQLEPVEIGITASVHIPKLVMLNCEPSDLCFEVHPYDVMTSMNQLLKVSKSIRMGNTSQVVANMIVTITPPFHIKSVTCLTEASIGFPTESNIILQHYFADTSNLVLQTGEICDIEVEFSLTADHMCDIFTGLIVVNSDETVDAFQIHRSTLKFIEDKSLVEDNIYLEIKLYQPILVITKQLIQFGRVFVSDTKEEFFYITSKTGRDKFKLELGLEKESPFTLEPKEGILEPDKPEMIVVTFRPGESKYYKDDLIMHNCILDNVFTIILDGFGVLDYREHCLNYSIEHRSSKNKINDYGQQLPELGSAFIFD